MSGYAANARLDGSVPRFVGRRAHPGRPAAVAGPVTEGPTRELIDGIDRIELVGHPMDERFADRLASIAESWSQITFYLFDPQSWR